MKAIIGNRNCCCRRGILQRNLTTVLLFTCATVIGVVSGLDFVIPTTQIIEKVRGNTTGKPSLAKPALNKTLEIDTKLQSLAEYKRKRVCFSAECVHTASAVLRKMKMNIKPCDDFYNFACGSYLDEIETPQYTVAGNTFATMSAKWQLQLRSILIKEKPHTEPKHRRLPNILYKACMDKTSIANLSAKYIHEIAASLGGWPLLNGSLWDKENSWTWQELVKKFRRIGFSTNSVISFLIGLDSKNTTKRIINLNPPILASKWKYLDDGINDTSVLAYYKYMVDIAVLFGAEKVAARKELKESLQFHIKLADISWPDKKPLNSSDLYRLYSIKQLQEAHPYVHWLDYINTQLPEGLPVDENEIIKLSVPSFFDELGKLLERTNKRVIANYMMWHFYAFTVNFLTEEFRIRLSQYETTLMGRRVHIPRWKECVDITFGSLPLAVGSLYTRKYFNQDSRAITLEMVANIRFIFAQILDNVKWMDDITKQEAKKKLQSMTTEIGYPDEMLNDAKLEEFYRKLEMDPTKYFASYLNLTLFAKEYLFAKLKMPVLKTDWMAFQNMITDTAYYSININSMNFPTGILQVPFFQAQRPKYMNYGAIGSIIGHEITHGFDSTGRQFDGNGNVTDWWQPDAKKAYSEKAKCVIQQYGNYTDKETGLRVDGVKTQNENIADITGITASYLAYNQWVARNGQEPQLPGLNYTPQQMFWISAAQAWCVKYTSEKQFSTGYHSPDEFRVLGAFGNIKHFSCDFQCRQNTTMNPAQKCKVF